MATLRRSRRAVRVVVAIAALAAAPGLAAAAGEDVASVARPKRFAVHRPAVWDIVPAPLVAGPRPAAQRLRTVPTFTDTFTSGGTDYSYAMVGTNPRRSQRRLVIPAVIVPIRFVFADGTVFDPAGTVGPLRRSPLFRKTTFGADTTQFADAFQRAQFGMQGTSWHVLLGRPSVTRTMVVRIPQIDGTTQSLVQGGSVGLVEEAYFSEHVVPALVNQLRLSPTKLTIFWSRDVELVTPGSDGVILGEHGVGYDRAATTGWTWVWASWHGTDTVPESDADIAPLSHEIAEWYDNPLGGNVGPQWQAPFYPCNNRLEVGDPLVGASTVVNGYHLQDEAFLSWFARDVPSKAAGGAYSFFGTLTAPSPGCTPP